MRSGRSEKATKNPSAAQKAHNMKHEFNIIVIGAGHAGCEAALAAARLGAKTLLITHSVDRIAAMSCNPAIGGTAKGHLVKEIDALGGEMGKAIDHTGIQFRVLNRSRGFAVWSSRAQADMGLYQRYMKKTLEQQTNLHLRQDSVEELLIADDKVQGVNSKIFGTCYAQRIIITSGTFLNGLMHIGNTRITAGRAGDAAAVTLAAFFPHYGFAVGRLKTGTTPRLDARSIDYSQLTRQDSDDDIIPFSFSTGKITQPLLPCHITATNPDTHTIINRHLDQSPLYSGAINSVGPRYCPSIEDKVVKFPDRQAHQIFLEPHGYDTCEVYPNGISTSLPLAAQVAFVRSVAGLQKAEIIRAGYAIEYDFINPQELYPSLATKRIAHLYLAGQINGTTGYEEAAAQGLIAGINATRSCQGREPLVLSRTQAYIGVMIDDLVTKGTNEPYRMFTSRAEHRLHLREDNADLRLTPLGIELGLVTADTEKRFLHRRTALQNCLAQLQRTTLPDGRGTACDYWKRPEVSQQEMLALMPQLRDFTPRTLRSAEIEIRYEGYIKRDARHMKLLDDLERVHIPSGFEFAAVTGLRREFVEKLTHIKPTTLGQAARISGMTPAAVQLLHVFLHHRTRKTP